MMQAKIALQYLNVMKHHTFIMKPGASKKFSVHVDSSWRSPTEKNRRSRTEILIYFGILYCLPTDLCGSVIGLAPRSWSLLNVRRCISILHASDRSCVTLISHRGERSFNSTIWDG